MHNAATACLLHTFSLWPLLSIQNTYFPKQDYYYWFGKSCEIFKTILTQTLNLINSGIIHFLKKNSFKF